MERVAILAALIFAGAVAIEGQQQQPPPTPGSVQTPPPGGQVATGPGRGRPTPPQPQQKPGVEYFIGTWSFTWTGRESPVSTGPRAGTTTYTRRGAGEALDIRTEGKSEDSGASFKESGSAEWDAAQKILTFKETLSTRTELVGTGNWSSPLSIRYESQPVQVGKQSVRVRRTYSILSAQSYTVAEELSIDGGPFQRLGNGAFSKQ